MSYDAFKSLGGLSVLILIVAIVAVRVAGQDGPYSRVIEKKGWKVPAVSSMEGFSKERIEIDGYFVWRTQFKLPEPKPSFKLKSEKCEFRALASYAVEGETFAIIGECLKFGTDPRYGKFYYGGLGTFTFIDEDGDAKFETRYSSGRPMVFVPLRFRTERNRVPIAPLPPPPARKTT